SSRSVQDAMIAAERLYEITDLDNESYIPDEIVLKNLPVGNMGNIVFENVYFSYGTRAKVLSGLDLEIKSGCSTAITGKSGSGKSTIAAILQTLYEPTEGRVLINGLDLKFFKKQSIREAISVVPQNVELIAGTIIENIALGDFEPSLEKIVNISRLLGIDQFVETMPGHYYTHLEENGTNLSGGQRQRLAIARALYRDPEILILDEATSNLDARSENFVQAAFNWFLEQGKTLIIIAHRLSTIKNCDQIIVLDEGVLAGKGTHYELLENCAAYNELWNLHARDSA
ncbi:MAG: ATP-binding cassette domain-containing protein, partial [Chitinophagaceae bacterium]